MYIIENIYLFSNFLEFYEKKIGLKLCEIDVFVKTSEGDMDLLEVSKVLYISIEELENIMFSKNFNKVNKENFFDIMENGSSYICKLFSREKKCGSPYVYTREQISYIYDLDIEIINRICDKFNIDKLTSSSLLLLFSKISLN